MPTMPAPSNFLPNFCAIPMVFAVVVTAELLAVLLTLAAGFDPAAFWTRLSLVSLLVQWIALMTTALLCLGRRWLSRAGHTLVGLLAWGLLLLVTAAVTEAAILLRAVPDGAVGRAGLMVQTLGIAAIAGALLLRYLYEQHRQRERERAVAEARFDALQARIRPHFLFNSMNAIASLIPTRPDLAEEVVHDLADLFRASLADSRRRIPLQQELALARAYLRIEAQRLGERLRVEWDLEDMPMSAQLPPLVLQPLLENAVYHGVEPATGGGAIQIAGRFRRGVVNLSVRNSLPAETQRSRREGHQMALQNVRDRLRAAFGDQAGLTLGRVDDHYQVRVHFPAEPLS
jgi:two-component system sensor histidine kinase AlgZ